MNWKLTSREAAITQFLADVHQEAVGALRKFPGNTDMMLALDEEKGELSQAMLEHNRNNASGGDVYAEAVQVAAMALRVAMEGDAACRYSFEQAYQDVFVPLGGRTATSGENWLNELRREGFIPPAPMQPRLFPRESWAGASSEAM